MITNIDKLLASIRANDLDDVRAILSEGMDVEGRDENGWTPLCWAAGVGDAPIVGALIDRGADVFAVGKDQRTPYLIALAAGHADAARILGEAESRLGSVRGQGSSRLSEHRQYCRAYPLATLRQFVHWRVDVPALDTDDVVFVHRDMTVSRSIWVGEDVIFDAVTDEWREFCDRVLNFRPPNDLDLVTQMRAS